MNITNKFNLPEAFLSFARGGKYDRGNADISVTTLIDSPRVNILKQQRRDEIETDVSDMIWPLFGTAVHHMLESSTPKGNVTMEERLFVDINGWIVSGQIDHQEEVGGFIHISDYKVTSVWSVIYGKADWANQLNCYAHMVRLAKGADVRSIRIVAILRDWQRREAQFKPDYPQAPVAVVDIPLWDAAKAQAYMEERVHLHQNAQMMWDAQEAVVECTDEERWTKPDTWAVMKAGGKRATKVFDNQDDATKWVVEQAPTRGGYSVVRRDGGRTRCEQYCSVSEFCTQWAMERVAAAAPEMFGETND
jgi:hypothetical protein